jgi:hypothetical protein
MMLIIMRDLKSFDHAATLSQGQKHEVARLVEALCQRYDGAQELFSPDPGDVGRQLRCNRATHPFVMHLYENRHIFARRKPG